jgi:hypothetical protein
MLSSWYLLPTGKLQKLTRTQDLLVELKPVVEDLIVAYQQLRLATAACARTRGEARSLIVRARRQRLGLRLLANGDSTGSPSGLK